MVGESGWHRHHPPAAPQCPHRDIGVFPGEKVAAIPSDVSDYFVPAKYRAPSCPIIIDYFVGWLDVIRPSVFGCRTMPPGLPERDSNWKPHGAAVCPDTARIFPVNLRIPSREVDIWRRYRSEERRVGKECRSR